MKHRHLWHVTLDTGHGRRSYRDELEDGAVSLVAGQIAEMLAGVEPEVVPGYTLTGAQARGALLATVSSSQGPIATIAVAPSGRSSGRLWEELSRSAQGYAVSTGNAPEPPWCAVRLYPAVRMDVGATEWLGDFERCLAWAWIEQIRS